jgi:hypothetical protein
MFADKPIVTHHDDGVPRFVVFGRNGCDGDSIDSRRGHVERAIEELFPGPMIVHHVQHCPDPHCDGNGLAELRQLMDSRQCDVVVVDDMTRLDRRPARSLRLIQTLVEYKTRFISIADRIDTAAEGWQLACFAAALNGSLACSCSPPS